MYIAASRIVTRVFAIQYLLVYFPLFGVGKAKPITRITCFYLTA